MADISLSLGALADPIGKQLVAQGFRLPKAVVWQRRADAITTLAIAQQLTESQARSARNKLVNRIAQNVVRLQKIDVRRTRA